MTSKPPVKISVKLGSANNTARISASETGSAAIIASSTCSGETAAYRAARKHFKIGRPTLRLRLLQRGDVCAKKPEIYTAFLK